jgi:uncharacterized membrane protein YdfJ with MMPL/SSD domain
VRELRTEVVEDTFAGTEAEALVGGTTSENLDYFDSVIDPAPWVIALVLLLTFVFLTVVFRSIVVAGTAVVLNPLSVGAAYGLLVLVFQEGVGAAFSGSKPRTRSKPGCRSSSSRFSSACRWTTRCSCSPASGSATTSRATRATR